MDQVIIRDLLTRGKIGISEKERERPQDILVNIRISADLHHAGETDQLSDCIDYSETAKMILTLVERNKKRTMEALAADIANACLENPRVKSVVVRAEKTSAVRFAAAVGVEIERKK